MDQVAIFVDMFYLPFEHGRRGIQMLQEFSWLHENSYVMRRNSGNGIDDQVVNFFAFLSVFVFTRRYKVLLFLALVCFYCVSK